MKNGRCLGCNEEFEIALGEWMVCPKCGKLSSVISLEKYYQEDDKTLSSCKSIEEAQAIVTALFKDKVMENVERITSLRVVDLAGTSYYDGGYIVIPDTISNSFATLDFVDKMFRDFKSANPKLGILLSDHAFRAGDADDKTCRLVWVYFKKEQPIHQETYHCDSMENIGSERFLVSTVRTAGQAGELVKRGILALEDCEWEKAEDYFEEALNFQADSAEAYLGKLLADMKLSSLKELGDSSVPFDDNKNYGKIIRFADDDLKNRIQECLERINNRNAQMARETAEKEVRRAEELSGLMEQIKITLQMKALERCTENINKYEKALLMVDELDALKVASDNYFEQKDIIREKRDSASKWRRKEYELELNKLSEMFDKMMERRDNLCDELEMLCPFFPRFSLWPMSKNQKKQFLTKNYLEKQLNALKNDMVQIKKWTNYNELLSFQYPMTYNEAVKKLSNQEYKKFFCKKYGDLYPQIYFAGLAAGDSILFGSRKGDYKKWIVINRENGEALLLQADIVHIDKESIEAIKSAVGFNDRKLKEITLYAEWMNSKYLNEVFEEYEQDMITLRKNEWQILDADIDNDITIIKASGVLYGKVFSLSVKEVCEYLFHPQMRCIKDKGSEWVLRDAYNSLKYYDHGSKTSSGIGKIDFDGNLRAEYQWFFDMMRPAIQINF